MLKKIPVDQFSTRAFYIWNKTWLLLTSGDFEQGKYNTMTVAWGSFGNMWNMPLAMVVVRPSRYTYEFFNQYDTFTLTAFPKEYKPALDLLGTKSGRDGDKIKESGLTPAASEKIAAPGFEESDLWIECQNMYWHDFDPEKFMLEAIHKQYLKSNYHRMFFGKILYIRGDRGKYQSD
jgi:flavin reductase (DIM6/NTAB) family NADH-FMN oxidoreductase RutF